MCSSCDGGPPPLVPVVTTPSCAVSSRQWLHLFVSVSLSDYVVEREEKFGGNVSFQRYEDLERAYAKQVQCVCVH